MKVGDGGSDSTTPSTPPCGKYLPVEHDTMHSILDDVSVRTTVALFHTASIQNAALEDYFVPGFFRGFSKGFRWVLCLKHLGREI